MKKRVPFVLDTFSVREAQADIPDALFIPEEGAWPKLSPRTMDGFGEALRRCVAKAFPAKAFPTGRKGKRTGAAVGSTRRSSGRGCMRREPGICSCSGPRRRICSASRPRTSPARALPRLPPPRNRVEPSSPTRGLGGPGRTQRGAGEQCTADRLCSFTMKTVTDRAACGGRGHPTSGLAPGAKRVLRRAECPRVGKGHCGEAPTVGRRSRA